MEVSRNLTPTPTSALTLPHPHRRWLSGGVFSCCGTTSYEDEDDDNNHWHGPPPMVRDKCEDNAADLWTQQQDHL